MCECDLYTWIPEEFLHHISLLGEQGPENGEADSTERAEYSGKSANDFLQGDPGDRDHCTLSYVLTCTVHPTCKYRITSSDEDVHLLKFTLF
jgi:hypothetical protein